jgi:hypothetical protein
MEIEVLEEIKNLLSRSTVCDFERAESYVIDKNGKLLFTAFTI